MVEKSWKRVERQVAEYWGGARTPLSGRNSRHDTSADAINLPVPAYLEVKHGAGCPKSVDGILRLFADTEGKARLEGKTAFLILHEKRTQEPVRLWPVWCRVRVALVRDGVPGGGVEHIGPVAQGLARRLFFEACDIDLPDVE